MKPLVLSSMVGEIPTYLPLNEHFPDEPCYCYYYYYYYYYYYGI